MTAHDSRPAARAPGGGAPNALRVAVVGAGIGGLTLAAALARVGLDCTVFDRAEHLSEVGAGLQLAPGTVKLLRRLGVGAGLAERSVRPLSLDLLRWEDGGLLSRAPLGATCEERYGAPYTTVHRGQLHALLLARTRAAVRPGHRLTAVEEQPDAVVLRFADGTEHRADVVVGADGIRSVVRSALAADDPVFSGQFMYRGLVPAQRFPALAADPRVRVWLGPGRHCVCYPVDGGRSLSFAATTPGAAPAEESWTAAAEAGAAAAAYRGWDATVVRLLDAADRVGRWALHDRTPLERWSTDRITLLGDAAHPMLPFAAQGANQAVEDAVTLAVRLAAAGAAAVPEALRRYQELRVPRTTDLQRSARERTARMHLPDGPDQRKRDVALARPHDPRETDWSYGYDALTVAVRGG
ncbi:FAD-dependent monooxygenase [Streptomyces bohaiensis]|uniref:FAD-dependent monooxygenase n=1 Tax=Streptomyces bohaiensis TaxID=1431344 RepID=UPI0028B22ABA|nr:FAD-dependent monooxygenase [Streptomyces bohaiensis]